VILRPPIFFVFPDGEVQSFVSVEQVEGYVRAVRDFAAERCEAWDSSGAPLSLARTDDGGIDLSLSGVAPEPERLRLLLVAALDREIPGVMNDLPLDEVVPIAARMFSAESSGWPCVIVYAALVLGAGAVIYWRVLR
jgi:hypothetical protein